MRQGDESVDLVDRWEIYCTGGVSPHRVHSPELLLMADPLMFGNNSS